MNFVFFFRICFLLLLSFFSNFLLFLNFSSISPSFSATSPALSLTSYLALTGGGSYISCGAPFSGAFVVKDRRWSPSLSLQGHASGLDFSNEEEDIQEGKAQKQRTMGKNRKKHRINSCLIIHCPMSEEVSEVRERASKEHSGGRE